MNGRDDLVTVRYVGAFDLEDQCFAEVEFQFVLAEPKDQMLDLGLAVRKQNTIIYLTYKEAKPASTLPSRRAIAFM